MLVGHVGAAMVAKQAAPRLSLGAAVLASVLADLLLFALVVAGVEQVEFRSTMSAAAAFTPLRVALSHSLAMGMVWGIVLALLYAAFRKRVEGAWIVAALVVSHWVLDIIGQPVLPLAPRTAVYVGSALSRWIVVGMVVEAVIWVGALIMYVRDSRSVNSAGRYVFWGGIASWTYVWWANQAGPPRQAQDAPIEMLTVLLLIVAWGYWMNRARVMKTGDLAVSGYPADLAG
jgi:hypothetical protein